jgi:hydroxymethylglutaryl-CoA reductase (NADPH)
MRGSHLLPTQLRSLGKSDSWLNRTLTSNLLALSHTACQHPIHTIVIIALLASTSYVGLLQESLFDSGVKSLQHNGRVDVDALLKGSRTLELSKSTAWKWQFSEDSTVPESSLVCGHADKLKRHPHTDMRLSTRARTTMLSAHLSSQTLPRPS